MANLEAVLVHDGAKAEPGGVAVAATPATVTPDAVTPAPDQFVWLLSPRQPCPANPPDETTFAKACDFALAEWQALPAVAAKLLAWGGPRFSGSRQAQRVKDRDLALRALARVQLSLAARLVSELSDARVRYVFLKGSAVRFIAYQDPADRCGKDWDIAVDRDSLSVAEEIAIKLGFEPAEWSYETRHFHKPDPVLRKSVEAQHYELGFLARRQRVRGLSDAETTAIRRDMPDQMIWHEMPSGDLGCYVTLDVHHGLSLDIEAGPMLDDAHTLEVDGLRVRVPSSGWLAFQLLFKLYWEGVHSYRKGGYQFADLARLIPMLDGAAFAKMAALLGEHNLEVAGHYVMRRLASDLGLGSMPLVESFVRRTSIAPVGIEPNECNDFGDVWPKLWGLR